LNEKAIEAALQASQPSSSESSDAGTWNTGASDAGAHTSALTLANALAEANHARLIITSKPQQGSLFEVSFTTRSDSAAPAPDRRAAGGDTGTTPVDSNR
jgi:hypothetical protein